MAKPELINEKMLLAVTVLCEPGVLQNSIWKTAADIIALILEVRPEFINEDLIKMLSGCFLFQGIGFEIGLSFAQALRVAVEKRPEYAEYAIRELLAVLGDEGIYDYSASAVIKALGLIVPYLPEEKRRHYLARILPFCRVSKIEFFNGGNAQSNYPNFVEGLLANSQTAQLQNPPAEVPRFRRVGDIRSLPRADKTLAEMLKDCQLVRDLAQAPNGALGRTLVYWNGKEKKYLAIKVLKDREDAGNLLLESEMMDYLNDNYDALGLVGQYPQPVMIDGQRAVRTKSLPAEAVSALTEVRTKEGEAIVLDSRYGCYTLMAYEYENRDYFTYLNNASLGAEEFFDAIFLGLHDLFCLARVGIIHTALIDVFHTPQTSGRVDRGRYLWMADIIRRFRGQSGAGRLHNWKKAVAFPNLRVSGLGDLAEFMPLLDMVANPYHPRVVHLSEVNGFGDNKDALQNVFLANFLGDYLLALTLITGSYLEEQSLLSWQDPEMLAEFMRELFNKAYEIFKQTEVFPLAGQIDWQLLARQMAYFMAGDYIGDFSPFTDEHERLAILREKGIFRPDADLRFGEYRRGNWSETEGWPGSLGPINGPLPLQELVRAIYFYTAFMATRIMDNYSTPDRLPLACALKTIGAVIDQSVVGQLENQEPRWQEQARRVVAQLYSKDVGIAYGFTGRIDNVPVKIIQDKNLHPAVDAWSFWAEGDPESKVLVIVTREILAAEIMDEIMFHEYMEWKWIEYYIANCLHTYGNIGRQLTESELWEIRRRAHILTWVKQAQVFQGEEGITPLHKKQLDDLRQQPEKMQALISEHFERGGECRGRSLHRTLILGHLGLDAATAAVGYENSVIAYLQKLLIPWNRQKLYQRLYLLERAFPLQTFLEELEVELDTRSMDELTRIDAIPVVIRNEDLLSEHFGVRSTKVIAAKLVMSAYGPVAISFQIARRRILIDIVELSRPDAEHLSEMKKEVSWAITRYRVDIVKECRVIDVDSWDLGRVPELFYSYAVSDPGTERLVSLSLDQIRERGPATFLALGEGTGIIGLAVARNSNARVVYADHKKGALVNAAIAVTAVGLSERLMVKESLLFDNLIGKRFDVIVYDVVNGQSAKTSIIPQSVRLLEDLLTQFADHLTADGVLFLRIPGNNQQAARLIQEFSERQLLQYEEIAGEGVKIHAIRIHPEKRDLPVVGPLKLIGGEMSPDTISLLHKREIRKLGWRQQAAAVAAERYSRDVKVILGDDERTERIELLIKHIQVTDLPPEVAVAYFWEEWEDGERCLVIISRRPFADEIRDEVIFYGYMHAKWTNIFIADHPKGETELTSDEREEIRQQAHVLAASQQAHVFRKTNYARIKGPDGYARHQAVFGVSKLHEQQLRQMDLNQLGTIISEFNLGSDGHRRLRESYFRARFMRAIEEYERNVKRYAIRRGLQLIFENKKGLLAVSRPRGKVKEVYFDMYGTLDYLEAHELRFLFGLLKETYGEQLKINIVSDAGTPKNPYRVLERSGVLEYVDTIVCTRSKPGTDCSDLLGVNVVLRGSITKIAHIREVCRQKLRSGEYDKDDRVLFFDDGGDNFGSEDSGESRIIQVGVIGRNNSDPEFRSLIYGDGRQIGAVNYYVGSLHNLDTIRQLLALIEPEAIPVARLTAAGMAMRELEAEEALATSL